VIALFVIDRDYKIIVYKDGMADFDQQAHQFSLEGMKKTYGAEIV
jgi:nicotinamidase/pyrazinamidase